MSPEKDHNGHAEPVERLPNELIAVLALQQLGGGYRHVDLEEVAVVCYELAQRRFSWRTRMHPNLATTLQALVDAGRRRRHPPYVVGTNRKGRGPHKLPKGFMLTPEGVSVASGIATSVGLGSLTDSTALRQEETAVLDRLASQSTFKSDVWSQDALSPPRVAEIIGFLPDAPQVVVSNRLSELLTMARAAERSDVEEYLKWLQTALNS